MLSPKLKKATRVPGSLIATTYDAYALSVVQLNYTTTGSGCQQAVSKHYILRIKE